MGLLSRTMTLLLPMGLCRVPKMEERDLSLLRKSQETSKKKLRRSNKPYGSLWMVLQLMVCRLISRPMPMSFSRMQTSACTQARTDPKGASLTADAQTIKRYLRVAVSSKIIFQAISQPPNHSTIPVRLLYAVTAVKGMERSYLQRNILTNIINSSLW